MSNNETHHTDGGLVAHFPFTADLENHAQTQLPVTNTDVEITAVEGGPAAAAAAFNGKSSYLEIPACPDLNFNTDNFSLSLWVETDENTDIIGDFISKYDSKNRRGWSLNAVTASGTTTTAQSNYRNLHFGIDDAKQDAHWNFCGRPGNACFIYALATVEGHLYAGTFEKEADQQGHLWRYRGQEEWEDLGSPPDGANAVTSVIGYQGDLYCSSARYYPTGSRLGPFLNKKPGGNVYRIADDGQWINCGNPGAKGAVPEPEELTGYEAGETGLADDASALTVFQGELYAISFRRRGVFKYQGGSEWQHIGLDTRVMTLAIYQEQLYALANGGPLYRYDGENNWTYCGTPGQSTQTYAAIVYRGKFLVGTWPDCAVLAYEGGEEWQNYGTVGYEKEVMAMSLYNSKVYFGTLPMANAWRFDDDGYTFVGNTDSDCDHYLKRLWSMAVYQGKLYAGTLPSGQVMSFEAGKMATHDRALPAGWHHIAAVRENEFLRLYLDGEPVAASTALIATDFNVNNEEPLKIGFGAHEYFKGKMSDLRIYNRALLAEEVQAMQIR